MGKTGRCHAESAEDAEENRGEDDLVSSVFVSVGVFECLRFLRLTLIAWMCRTTSIAGRSNILFPFPPLRSLRPLRELFPRPVSKRLHVFTGVFIIRRQTGGDVTQRARRTQRKTGGG